MTSLIPRMWLADTARGPYPERKVHLDESGRCRSRPRRGTPAGDGARVGRRDSRADSWLAGLQGADRHPGQRPPRARAGYHDLPPEPAAIDGACCTCSTTATTPAKSCGLGPARLSSAGSRETSRFPTMAASQAGTRRSAGALRTASTTGISKTCKARTGRSFGPRPSFSVTTRKS